MSGLYDYSDITRVETRVGLPAIPHRQFMTPLPEPPPPSTEYMSRLTNLVVLGLTILVVLGTVIIGLTIVR